MSLFPNKRIEVPDKITGSKKWKKAWSDINFRKKLITGIIILGIILLFIYPPFFRYIETRKGNLINDPLLESIQATNVSIPAFICIWGIFFLFIYRVVSSPPLLLQFLIAYIILSFARMGMILTFPLEPPSDLIELKDPLISLFIGQKFIEKDLFFSGHTSTIILFLFCFEKKIDKWLAASAALIIGILLIIQHVHYTIDIAAAPLFAYISYRLAKKLLGNSWKQNYVS
ncbi:MAG: phosphatase PAP2-related protein [Chitinophagaceae bacterium]